MNLLATGAVIATFILAVSAQSPAKVDFARDVQPLLRSKCYGCHGPALQSGGLRLDRRRDSMPNRVGANGARIVPGSSTTSRLYLRVAGGQAGLQMPPTGALAPDEIDLIKHWIDQGAEWPDELAGDLPSPPQDARAAELMNALRRGDQGAFERFLRASPQAARGAGAGGTTPLMYAALYGGASPVRQLLDAGADPNASNEAGATALMWAIDNPDVTRLLLERGANASVRSADGQTPLVLAAARFGAIDVLKLLLEHGASLENQPVLARAASAGDAAQMRLLIDRGSKPTGLPIDLAIRTGCSDCVQLLLQLAGPEDLNQALQTAARYGDSNAMRMLLDRGAAPTGAVLRSAAASEKIPLEGVTALLDRGVRDPTALDLAMRHGDTAIVAALKRAGASENTLPIPELKRPPTAREPRAAVEKSLPLLQHADTVFLRTAGCVSCHNNSLFLMTAASARKKNIRVDEQALQSQLTTSSVYLESWRERVLQDIPIPGSVDTISYILAGLAAADYRPDPATDALARYLKRRQTFDGGWRIASQRPPLESSDIEVTALVLRSLQTFAPAPQAAEYEQAVRKGTAWLTHAQPRSTEDRVFQLLGLAWARADRADIAIAARNLIALQRDDGGWSQIPTLSSDAYATGQALTALAETGSLAPDDPVYRRGVQFLLKTQLEDGSWYVRSRALPIQPYFDSEFPHGRDQFIAAAATNWATMALVHAVR